MIDLEEEFQKMMSDMYSKVQSKFESGAISAVEAEDLRTLILHRTGKPESWEGSYESDDGWYASMNC